MCYQLLLIIKYEDCESSGSTSVYNYSSLRVRSKFFKIYIKLNVVYSRRLTLLDRNVSFCMREVEYMYISQ